MRPVTRAEPVPAPVDALVLHLGRELLPSGLVVDYYSTAPGVVVSLAARPGPDSLPPDHPAILAEVARAEEARRGYTGNPGDQPG